MSKKATHRVRNVKLREAGLNLNVTASKKFSGRVQAYQVFKQKACRKPIFVGLLILLSMLSLVPGHVSKLARWIFLDLYRKTL